MKGGGLKLTWTKLELNVARLQVVAAGTIAVSVLTNVGYLNRVEEQARIISSE